MKFYWDHGKDALNFVNHGVWFTEASTVFADPLSTTVADPDHSDEEERWLTTGLSLGGRILIVWHTNRGETVRIIGARQVTPQERRTYETGE